MKKAYVLSSILLVVLSVLTVLVVVGIPLSVTLTTNDKSASFAFFLENLIAFSPVLPFFLLALIPVLAIQGLLQYKLGITDLRNAKQRFCICLTAEAVTLIAAILILASIAASNATVI